jgi:hypothetical protein
MGDKEKTAHPNLSKEYEALETFLLKLHSGHNLGGAEPRPKRAGEWEGTRLNFKNQPKALVGDGDVLIV